ncbi:MAG: hypothetical protein GY811_05075 [Myxococcales bacterium]|nr:hypothetical protein [Myxococcales bacterium]
MSKSSSVALTRFLLCATSGVAALSMSQHAWAQPEPEPGAETAPAGDEVELSEEGIADESDDLDFGSGSGSEENPGAPNSTFDAGDKDKDKPKEKADKASSGYPARSIERPLNLPGGMVQVALEIPIAFDPFAVSGTLTGSYGITRNVEAGLQYSPGRYADDFAVGRAVAIGGQYLITDFVAAEISLPMHLDPFAMGLNLAAPFKYTFFDSFSLVAGENLLSIKLHEFQPSAENATQNDAFIAARNNNTIVPAWALNFAGGAIYQIDEKMALDAVFGTRFDDTNDAATSSLDLGLLFANSNKLDFGAKIGVSDLANFTESLALRFFLNSRI